MSHTPKQLNKTAVPLSLLFLIKLLISDIVPFFLIFLYHMKHQEQHFCPLPVMFLAWLTATATKHSQTSSLVILLASSIGRLGFCWCFPARVDPHSSPTKEVTHDQIGDRCCEDTTISYTRRSLHPLHKTSYKRQTKKSILPTINTSLSVPHVSLQERGQHNICNRSNLFLNQLWFL